MALQRGSQPTVPPRSGLQSSVSTAHKKAEEPGSREDRVSYGIIEDVKEEGQQVKVMDMATGKTIAKGAYVPVLNDLEDVFLRWGQIRKGMKVRIFWRGRHGARKPLIEIIGAEDVNFLIKDFRENEIPTKAYKLMGGGLTSL